MKKLFYAVTAATLLLTACFFVLYAVLESSIWLTLGVTAGTTCWHFAMRLAVGFAVERFVRFEGAERRFWFREHAWEAKLYRWLRVRRWARRVPTFRPEQFDVQRLSVAQLIEQTCRSELVHEIIVPAGYLSLFFCLFFEDPVSEMLPFLLTAFFAGVYELQFILLQRYNRPRLLRHMERLEMREKHRKLHENP